MKYIAVASEFLTLNELDKMISDNQEYFDLHGYERIGEEEVSSVEKLAYFVATGGTEKQILQYEITRPENEEIVLLAHPDDNSLAACMEVFAKLRQLGKNGRIEYMAEIIEKKSVESSISPLSIDLGNARIGVIGAPSDWLVASNHSTEIVKENCNAQMIDISIDELIGAYLSGVTDEKVKEDLVSNSNEIIEPSEKDIDNNIKVYLALKYLVEKYKLDALTLRCFDLVKVVKTTGCFALSKLNDEGIIAGCEGDIPSVLGMLWSYQRTGKIPWMANPSRINLKENSIWLAHCTVPRNLVKSYRLRSHFESSLGVGIQGYFEIGQKINLIRVGGEELNKVWMVSGEIITSGSSENLCRTQIEVKVDSGDIGELLLNPLGNHLIIEFP